MEQVIIGFLIVVAVVFAYRGLWWLLDRIEEII